MRRFRYRLDSVLGHRRRLLRERQRDLAAAQSAVARMEKALVSLDACRRECQDQVRRSALGELDRTEMLRLRSYSNSLWLRILGGAQELAGLRAQAEERRRAMVTARQSLRALELLKEKSESEWSREFAREERRVLDELKCASSLVGALSERGGRV